MKDFRVAASFLFSPYWANYGEKRKEAGGWGYSTQLPSAYRYLKAVT
jgi:hypothetical protein